MDEDAEGQDREDLGMSFNPTADRAKNILPAADNQGAINRGEMEKLARMFSELPGPEQAKEYFFGYLSHIHLYAFMSNLDTQILSLMLDKACYSYMNSCPPWQWKRDHTIMLENVKAIFRSILTSAVGVKGNVINARTALNELRIQRGYADLTPPKKSRFGF
jgi:hypothetical protein